LEQEGPLLWRQLRQLIFGVRRGLCRLESEKKLLELRGSQAGNKTGSGFAHGG
jgi:hypothetical protein